MAREFNLPDKTGNALKTLRVNSGATGVEWASSGAGDVTKVGTPVNNQVGVWTGDGSIEGTAALTFDGTTLATTGAATIEGDLTLGKASTNTGQIDFKGTTSGTVSVKVADAAGTWTMTLPANDGDANQVLITNGSGVTSWSTPSGGGMSIPTIQVFF